MQRLRFLFGVAVVVYYLTAKKEKYANTFMSRTFRISFATAPQLCRVSAYW